MMEPISTPPQPVVSMQESAPKRWMWIIPGIVILVVAAVWFAPESAVAPESNVLKNSASISVVASTLEVSVGQRFTVDVVLNGNDLSLTAIDLAVSYDASKLKAITIAGGAFLPIQLAAGVIKDGLATITVASGAHPVVGGGVVAKITFEALTSGPASIAPASISKVAAVGYTKNVAGTMTSTTVSIR